MQLLESEYDHLLLHGHIITFSLNAGRLPSYPFPATERTGKKKKKKPSVQTRGISRGRQEVVLQ